jgi:Secretion system C-terminal sorting domain
MRKIYFITLLLLLTSSLAMGQCNLFANAVPGIFLDYQSTNLLNCSGVGFNPIMGRYYAVRAGNASFPMETWSSTGTQLFTTNAGFDWRGMWWNPNTSQLEGNGYAAEGLWRCDLDGSGMAVNSGSYIFTGQAQPDIQSVGDYDPVANEIVYYYSGSIYRYSRATNALIGSYPLLGIPVPLSYINNNTVVFTNCVGKEIGILDYFNKRIYVFQKNTGIYMGMSQLPAATVVSSSFRFSYANGLAWLFNLSLGNWYSFRILDMILPENALGANTIWFSTSTAQIDWESTDAGRYDHFQVERSVDGLSFMPIGDRDATDFESDNGDTRKWSLQDATTPNSPLIYYRVNAVLKSGETVPSQVMVLSRTDGAQLALGAWPVPADAQVNIAFEQAPQGSHIEVIDAAGKMIVHQDITEDLASKGSLQLETQTWAEGIYLLRIRDLKGAQQTQRLVIQH